MSGSMGGKCVPRCYVRSPRDGCVLLGSSAGSCHPLLCPPLHCIPLPCQLSHRRAILGLAASQSAEMSRVKTLQSCSLIRVKGENSRQRGRYTTERRSLAQSLCTCLHHPSHLVHALEEPLKLGVFCFIWLLCSDLYQHEPSPAPSLPQSGI